MRKPEQGKAKWFIGAIWKTLKGIGKSLIQICFVYFSLLVGKLYEDIPDSKCKQILKISKELCDIKEKDLMMECKEATSLESFFLFLANFSHDRAKEVRLLFTANHG